MKVELLANNQHHLPTIAQWYFDEWGYLNREKTLEKEIQNLQDYLNKDQIPMILIGIENDQLLGAVQLKFREMTIYPEKEHWLGGVYVSKNHRGKGVAREIILHAIEMAKSLEVKTLYLQTENLSGGLYRELGWKPIEKVNYHSVNVLVMEKQI